MKKNRSFLNLKWKIDISSKIYFKESLFYKENLKKIWNQYSSLVVLFDINLKNVYLNLFKEYLKNIKIPIHFIFMKGSEKNKSFSVIFKILKWMLKKKINRSSHLIVIGGGSLSDIGGLISGIYYRGIELSLIPSSLLAQIDAAIGGKAAINIPKYGKNLIGIFNPAKYIIIDISLLESLPEKEFNCGISELIKYGIIASYKFFKKIISLKKEIKKRNKKYLMKLIYTACKIKSLIVQKDPLDKGLRKILNFGHNICHALEEASQYKLKHGEALSIGILIELSISNHFYSSINLKELKVIETFFQFFNLPIRIPSFISNRKILKALFYDKKIIQSMNLKEKNLKIPFVLSDGIGKIRFNKRNGPITLVSKNVIVKYLNRYRFHFS